MTDEKPTPPEPVPAPFESSTLQPEPVAPPTWMPPAPPAPPAPSFWQRAAAAVVLVGVIAASAGAGIGWSLARVIEAPRSAAVATPSDAPIQPQAPVQPQPGGSSKGSLNA